MFILLHPQWMPNNPNNDILWHYNKIFAIEKEETDAISVPAQKYMFKISESTCNASFLPH